MKKIIALFVIMLAFGATANAQQKKAAAQTATQQPADADAAVNQAAAKDMGLLSETVKLTDDQNKNLKRLFQTKHKMLATPNLTEERKGVIYQNIETKLKSVLDADQIAKLDSNPELLKKLTH
ncbi:hypothetical protein HYN59_08630 [Flavobacterium album]|uniref:DUF4168 domain-containing protein n=1 Tax=Flavobacterium album TaxID=2175091 RepID=A0A2S1QXS6_9FLAO|nr:hypothetical protein [Flavobacterium album]AWH85184.1 hypothetical protein HYN59_08630 [Flavobacterium album]